MAEESKVSMGEESNMVSMADESNMVSMTDESNTVSNSQSPQTESEPNNATETFMSPQTESEPNNATETSVESPQRNIDSKKDVDPSGAPNGGVELTGNVPAKRKRGRPRKYETVGDEENMMAIVSAPPGFSSSYSESLPKRGRGRPKGSGKWQLLASRYGFPVDPAGGGLNTQVLLVGDGEDIVGKIYSLSQRTPGSLCVLSATGVVSTVFIRPPSSSGGLLRFQGRFQILTLSGSFTYGATRNTSAHGKHGMLSVMLSHPDGRVFGGAVAGAMTAYEPVQIIVTSFQQDTSKDTGKELKRRRSAESSSSTSILGNSGWARIPLPITPPTTGLNESCISPTPLMEFPANNGAGNLIASNHNMNPASIAGFSPNVLQSIPSPKTSSDIDSFVPLA